MRTRALFGLALSVICAVATASAEDPKYICRETLPNGQQIKVRGSATDESGLSSKGGLAVQVSCTPHHKGDELPIEMEQSTRQRKARSFAPESSFDSPTKENK